MKPDAHFIGKFADMLTRVLAAYETEVYESMSNLNRGAIEVPLRADALALLKEYDETLEKKEITVTHTSALPTQKLTAAPTRYIPVYVASKLLHAEKLKGLREKWPHIYFTMRWPVAASISSEQNRPAQHWLKDNQADIRRSQFVIVFAEEEDELKGAIYEAGYAAAYNIPTYIIGHNRSYSKWQLDEHMRRRPTLDHALEEISKLAEYPDDPKN